MQSLRSASFCTAALSVLLAVSTSSFASRFGSVHFNTTCDPAFAEDFNVALSLYYSFSYHNSLVSYQEVINKDPSCCIAYHMAACTFFHPIWDYISDDRLHQAISFSEQAQTCVQRNTRISSREVAYIKTLTAFSNHSDSQTPSARLRAYASAVKDFVYVPYIEDDLNAGIFYGLSLLAVGYYSESEPSEGFPHLSLAGLVEEEVMLRDNNSPGALHFIIHSYDQPATAYRALNAANRYLNASTAVPHAVHMPAHIFNDLGLWIPAVNSNQNSLNTAYVSANGTFTGDWYHGAYFLQFEILQKAMDCDASQLVDKYRYYLATNDPLFYRNLESVLRVPAHYFIETRQWEKAASSFGDLEKFYLGSFSAVWDESAWTRIYSNFVVTAAKAVLNYPPSDIIASCDIVIAANHTLYSDPVWKTHQLPYWRISFDQMAKSSLAWKAFRTESFDVGIKLMKEVVAFQISAWAPEVGHVWDAHEQLATMYLIRGLSGDILPALESFEAAMLYYPNRYHTLAGAAKSAQILGQNIKASEYYAKLIALTSAPFPNLDIAGVSWTTCSPYRGNRRPEIAAAHAFFDSMDNKATLNENHNSYRNILIVALIAVSIVAALSLSGLIYYYIWRYDKQRLYSRLAIEDNAL